MAPPRLRFSPISRMPATRNQWTSHSITPTRRSSSRTSRPCRTSSSTTRRSISSSTTRRPKQGIPPVLREVLPGMPLQGSGELTKGRGRDRDRHADVRGQRDRLEPAPARRPRRFNPSIPPRSIRRAPTHITHEMKGRVMSRIIFTALFAAALTASAAEPGNRMGRIRKSAIRLQAALPTPGRRKSMASSSFRLIRPRRAATFSSSSARSRTTPRPSCRPCCSSTRTDGRWPTYRISVPVNRKRMSNAIPAAAGDQITTSISCQCQPNGTNCTCDLVATNQRTGKKAMFLQVNESRRR